MKKENLFNIHKVWFELGKNKIKYNLLHKIIHQISEFSLFYPLVLCNEILMSPLVDILNMYSEAQMFSPILISKICTDESLNFKKNYLNSEHYRKVCFIKIDRTSQVSILKKIIKNNNKNNWLSFNLVHDIRDIDIFRALEKKGLLNIPLFIEINENIRYEDIVNSHSFSLNSNQLRSHNLFCSKCPEWIIEKYFKYGKKDEKLLCRGGIQNFSFEYLGEDYFKIKPCIHSNKFLLFDCKTSTIFDNLSAMEEFITVERLQKKNRCKLRKCALDKHPNLKDSCLSCPYISCNRIGVITKLFDQF